HRCVEDRLSYHELGARLRLALEQLELALDGLAVGIGDRAERELRQRLEQAASLAGVAAAQIAHRPEKAEGVEIVYRTRAVGLGGELVAGQRHHGVDAEGAR